MLFSIKHPFFIALSTLSLLCVIPPVLKAEPIKVVLEDREPEAATGFNVKKAVIGNEYMVASANPYATKAGLVMLEKGGSAVDAVIAAQLVLTLVEPQSSGIGGGTFMLHWHEQSNQQLTSFDGRETAPKSATSELFLDK